VNKVSGSSIALNVGERCITGCASRGDFTDRPHKRRGDRGLKRIDSGLISLNFKHFEMPRAGVGDVPILDPPDRVTVYTTNAPPRFACEHFSNRRWRLGAGRSLISKSCKIRRVWTPHGAPCCQPQFLLAPEAETGHHKRGAAAVGAAVTFSG